MTTLSVLMTSSSEETSAPRRASVTNPAPAFGKSGFKLNMPTNLFSSHSAKSESPPDTPKILGGASKDTRPTSKNLENRAAFAPFAVQDTQTVTELGSSSSFDSLDSLEDQPEDDPHPDGGWDAWRVVLGSFCGLLPVFGLVNSLGAVQAYISVHQLASKSESQVSWIFSIFICIECLLTGQVGYLFDCYGPYQLSIAGATLFTLGLICTSFCTQYAHFFVAFSVCCGAGAALLMTPEVAILGHWFDKKCGAATGLATMGGSLGGVVFPILLRRLYSTVGFAWAIRALALLSLGLFACSLALMKPRLKTNTQYRFALTTFFDAKSLKDKRFALLCVANFLGELGVINGLTFLTSYALANGQSESMSYALLAILNGAGMLGRVLPGFVSDRLGRFNTTAAMTFCGAATIFCVWLPFGKHTAGIVLFAITHGFCNGGIFSLIPVCCAQISRTRDYGRRYGSMYFVTSFTILLGVPLSGLLIRGTDYTNLIIFNGAVFIGAVAALLASRYCAVGFSLKKW